MDINPSIDACLCIFDMMLIVVTGGSLIFNSSQYRILNRSLKLEERNYTMSCSYQVVTLDFMIMDQMLRSAVGLTHSLRSDL